MSRLHGCKRATMTGCTVCRGYMDEQERVCTRLQGCRDAGGRVKQDASAEDVRYVTVKGGKERQLYWCQFNKKLG